MGLCGEHSKQLWYCLAKVPFLLILRMDSVSKLLFVGQWDRKEERVARSMDAGGNEADCQPRLLGSCTLAALFASFLPFSKFFF